MRTLLRWLTFIAQSIVMGLALAFVILYFRPDLMRTVIDSRQVGTVEAVPSYAEAVEKSAPAVVNIYTATRVVEDVGENPVRRGTQRNRTGGNLGSGVVVDTAGYIVTNNHVIEDAEQVWVQLLDGRIGRAIVVGSDPDTDLAVLRTDLADLPVLEFGRSDSLRIGDVVLAIGNPFGLTHTVTQGIVSATGRGQLGVSPFENFIQTDAAINIGNSGGALVNARGQLVGINTARLDTIRRTPEGIGFAIPANLVRGVMEQIIEHGRVIRGWLGVETQTLSAARAEALGLKGVSGIELVGVFADSPAARAGLQLGDVITHINGQPLRARQDALNLVASSAPGEQVRIRGVRRNQRFETAVTVAERPPRQIRESIAPG